MSVSERGILARSLLEAVQQSIGVPVANVAAWLGTAVAASWFWTSALHAPDPSTWAAPLEWLHQAAGWGGWSAEWATTSHQWLVERPEVYWPLLAAAVFTSSLREPAIATLTWTALLLALSLRPVETVGRHVLLLTAALAVAGYAVDKLHQWGSDNPDGIIGNFAVSSEQWVTGPLVTILRAVFLPLLVLTRAVGAYRAPTGGLDQPGLDLASDVSRLGDTRLSELPAREVLPFIARAMLLATDGDQRERRRTSAWLREPGPRGARLPMPGPARDSRHRGS